VAERGAQGQGQRLVDRLAALQPDGDGLGRRRGRVGREQPAAGRLVGGLDAQRGHAAHRQGEVVERAGVAAHELQLDLGDGQRPAVGDRLAVVEGELHLGRHR
jgi:hypothetical protein